MQVVSSTDAKRLFGTLAETAARTNAPIMVERSGIPSIVMISFAEYERFKALEDRFWGEMASKAATEGFLSKAESQDWFTKMQGKLSAAA